LAAAAFQGGSCSSRRLVVVAMAGLKPAAAKN